MKILMIGSNGYVGSMVSEILNKDFYVIGVGTKEQPTAKVNQYIRWDISKEDCPNELYDISFDIIIHMAACVTYDDMDKSLVETNCLGTYRIFQLARKTRVKKVIYVSSIPVVGLPNRIPIMETNETEPQTMYHATKLAGEYIISQLGKHGIDSIILRIPSPIAPNMPEKTIVPIFARKALNGETIEILGNGSRRQNYLDIRDFADAIKKCVKIQNVKGIFNIASNRTISNLELAKLCISFTNSGSRITFSEEKNPTEGQVWEIDVSKARTILGYEQKYKIEDSIRDIIDKMRG